MASLGIPVFIIATALAIALFTIYYKAVGVGEIQAVRERLRELASGDRLRKPWSRQEPLGLIGILTLATLWVSEIIHGIKTGVAGMIGLLLFLALGVMKPQQLKDLGWDIVVLMGGGLTLGRGLMETEFSDYLVQLLQPLTGKAFIAIVATSYMALLIGTVISSHTSATAFFAPLVIPLGYTLAPALGLAPRVSAALIAVLATVTLNYAIALPISTPPSAIVFGTGKVRTKTLLAYGIL